MPAQRPQRGGRELLTRGGSGRAQAGTTPTLALEPAVGREDAPVAEAAHAGQGRGGGSPRPGAGLEGARVRPASRCSGGTVSWPWGRWLCTCSRLENKTLFF